ncbi:COP9 signalosome complex subunit 1 [Eurytemora carolleeae]|uniref:COP9 signalosome complex subunit 1 n=1 Tax=Eurytemora carolleeae TaxID=1294199 RepID=UPI000C7893CF|nr:COP9 signalosome complex subunit 1 [Eurytemora carolleeae]|eukprot:XP_023341519.1 COP9 signalosome complex subunit 1-like [Eurytemora affinis]
MPGGVQNMAGALEPMQVDMGEENENDVAGEENEEELFTVDNPSLDLETYASSYSGLAKLQRLQFIAEHCPLLRAEALKLAISCVINTYNTGIYQRLHRKLAECVGGAANGAVPVLPDIAVAAADHGLAAAGAVPALDLNWVDSRNKSAQMKLEKLDNDLKNYKSNSIKESIRRGHDDLGDHFLDCGDLGNALKCYSRARDYCTSGRHVVSMCANVIKVSVYLQNWSHVMSYVNKALATPDLAEPNQKNVDQPALITKLKCAGGLADLMTRKYKAAARQFLEANLDYCDCPDLMSPHNVAMYGGLTALATFDRAELFKLVISSSQFKLFLELEPQLREVIQCFYDSKYGQCLKLLDELKDNFLLDIYLAPHVQTLFSMIRNRGLVQYFSPYLSADLFKMADSFNTNVANLEDELMKLILDGSIQARIDSHNKVLLAQDVDQRSQTFEKAIETADLYTRRARSIVLRSAILKANISVKCQARDQQEHVGFNNVAAQ